MNSNVGSLSLVSNEPITGARCARARLSAARFPAFFKPQRNRKEHPSQNITDLRNQEESITKLPFILPTIFPYPTSDVALEC